MLQHSEDLSKQVRSVTQPSAQDQSILQLLEVKSQNLTNFYSFFLVILEQLEKGFVKLVPVR